MQRSRRVSSSMHGLDPLAVGWQVQSGHGSRSGTLCYARNKERRKQKSRSQLPGTNSRVFLSCAIERLSSCTGDRVCVAGWQHQVASEPPLSSCGHGWKQGVGEERRLRLEDAATTAITFTLPFTHETSWAEAHGARERARCASGAEGDPRVRLG